MLTIEDCIELCGLAEEEIEAIAAHEHVPDIVAIELADYLVHSEDGIPFIRRMIVEDIDEARRRGDNEAVEKYRNVLKHFIATHPQRDQYL
jgi:hypothetical protein